MRRRVYTYATIDKVLIELQKYGYECHQTREGVLGSGDWICTPPEEGWYNYIIREVPLNEWSSGHIINKRVRLTKADKALLDSVLA